MADFGLITYGLLGRSVYLDTNVWSELAKSKLAPSALDHLLSERDTYLTLGPFQLLELSRRSDFAEGLVALFGRWPICIAARSASLELKGTRSFAVGFDYFLTMSELDPEGIQVFVEEFRSGRIAAEFDAKRAELIADRRWGIENSQADWGTRRGPWRDHFWARLDEYLAERCTEGGHTYHPERLRDPRYYRGAKLHFALLYVRHYLRPKRWQDSDLIDLLHAMEMAYAHCVVTERSLKATMTDIARDLPELECPVAQCLADLA